MILPSCKCLFKL